MDSLRPGGALSAQSNDHIATNVQCMRIASSLKGNDSTCCHSAGESLNVVCHACRALYHCNFCLKDISLVVRIKCAECADFDLCLECFSVGVEAYPHRSNHAYRVIDNLSFPLYQLDWGVRAHC